MKRLRTKHKDSVQCQRIFQGEGLRDADTVRKGSQNCSKSNIRDYLSLLMFSGRKTTWSLTCTAFVSKKKTKQSRMFDRKGKAYEKSNEP